MPKTAILKYRLNVLLSIFTEEIRMDIINKLKDAGISKHKLNLIRTIDITDQRCATHDELLIIKNVLQPYNKLIMQSIGFKITNTDDLRNQFQNKKVLG